MQLPITLTFVDVRRNLSPDRIEWKLIVAEAQEHVKPVEESQEKTPADFTGVITAAIVLPASLIVYHFRNADMAVSTFLCLGVVVFAAILRWHLRQFVWFWVVLLIVSTLQVPIIMNVHWPAHWVHGVVLLPVCAVDLLIVLGIIRLVESVMIAKNPDGHQRYSPENGAVSTGGCNTI